MCVRVCVCNSIERVAVLLSSGLCKLSCFSFELSLSLPLFVHVYRQYRILRILSRLLSVFAACREQMASSDLQGLVSTEQKKEIRGWNNGKREG